MIIYVYLQNVHICDLRQNHQLCIKGFWLNFSPHGMFSNTCYYIYIQLPCVQRNDLFSSSPFIIVMYNFVQDIPAAQLGTSLSIKKKM
jgi:hypothetical protein